MSMKLLFEYLLQWTILAVKTGPLARKIQFSTPILLWAEFEKHKENTEIVIFEENTSLTAQGALANCLQRLQNPKWPLGAPKIADGVWKEIEPRFLGASNNFR